MKILIIEDAEDTRVLLEHMLRQYETVGVGTFQEGLKTLEQGDFDLILLDLVLPDTEDLYDGLKTLRKITNQAIIVLTALEDPIIQRRVLELGADYFIHKSNFEQERLLDGLMQASKRLTKRLRK